MASIIPKEAIWIKDKATGFDPENNTVHTANGAVTYNYLVVAPGSHTTLAWFPVWLRQ